MKLFAVFYFSFFVSLEILLMFSLCKKVELVENLALVFNSNIIFFLKTDEKNIPKRIHTKSKHHS